MPLFYERQPPADKGGPDPRGRRAFTNFIRPDGSLVRMGGDFTIDTDRVRGLLKVTMCGFFSFDDVQRYHRAITAASDSLPMPPAEQRMINDITGIKIQSQEIVAAFRTVLADPRYRDRRVALVVASSLSRMQVQRILGGRVARLFPDTAQAEAWLFGPAATATAA